MSIIGFTCGCYDLVHAAHVNFLKACKEHCDYLIVALSTDYRIKELDKGSERPILSFKDRKIVIETLKPVDRVIEDYAGPIPWLNMININIYFKGKDWEGKLPQEEVELCKEKGIEIIFIDSKSPITTTSIVNKLKGLS